MHFHLYFSQTLQVSLRIVVSHRNEPSLVHQRDILRYQCNDIAVDKAPANGSTHHCGYGKRFL